MAVDSHSDDGSDIFWPGYVDAVTNLVLNLLFLLTIMTVAVFMFALELGRAGPGQIKQTVEQIEKEEKPLTPVEAAKDPVTEKIAFEAELIALRKQVQVLEKEAEITNKKLDTQKIVTATVSVPKPKKGLEQAAQSGGGIVVSYADDAVTLSETELATLRKTLAPVLAKGTAKIEVLVPAGFSEAKRLGFYRAMAVRNLLIDMKIPPAKIEVSVREGKASANAALVNVSPGN